MRKKFLKLLLNGYITLFFRLVSNFRIWREYNLNPWDADIVKRVLRTKEEPGKSKEDARIMDYEKIIHICRERIRQLEEDKQPQALISTVKEWETISVPNSTLTYHLNEKLEYFVQKFLLHYHNMLQILIQS